MREGFEGVNSAAEDVRKGFRGVNSAAGVVREGFIPGHLREGDRVSRLREKAASELLAHAAAGVGIRCRGLYTE